MENNKKKTETKKVENDNKKKVTKEEVKKEPKKEIIVDTKKEEKVESKKEAKRREEEANRKKENLIKGIMIFICVGLVIGLSIYASSRYNGSNTSFDFTEINVDKYLDLMAGDEISIIYVARPTCSYCQLQKPLLQNVAKKYNLTVYYLDTTDFPVYDDQGNFVGYNEDGQKFIDSDEVYAEGYGTPNTILVKGGSIVDGVYGYVESNELIKLFDNNGLIK